MKNVLNHYDETVTALVISTAVDQLGEMIRNESDVYGCDLHHEIYNTSESFIYYADAIAFCEAFGTFDAIEKVAEYEKDNFGEIGTDISNPCKVANMLLYILGEELLNDSHAVYRYWNEKISVKELIEIKEEIESIQF